MHREQTGPVRSKESLERHYRVEKGLAERLKSASREERKKLYLEVYRELFERVPDHPQLREENRDYDRALSRNKKIITRFLKPGQVFLEIGAGSCALSIFASDIAEKVGSLDVTDSVIRGKKLPDNLRFSETDGISIPLEESSVDLAFSHQLMEHLHPEDAEEQLRNIYRVLRPGGIYICITPSRIYGPHDISKYFDEQARGLHLKEYAYSDLKELFRKAGFKKTFAFIPLGGKFFRWPLRLIRFWERLLIEKPRKSRMKIACFAPVKLMLGGSNIRIAGEK